MENRTKVSNGTIFSDLQRLSEIFTATKQRAASLRQLSFLSCTVGIKFEDVYDLWHIRGLVLMKLGNLDHISTLK